MFKKLTTVTVVVIICSSFLLSLGEKPMLAGQKLPSFIQNFTGKSYIANLSTLNLNADKSLSDQEINQLMALIKQSNYSIKTVYLPLPIETLKTTELETLLKKLHRENIKIFYLINETALLTTPQAIATLVSDLLDYNEQQHQLNKEQFDGLVFDLKPYLHPAWHTQPERLLEHLLEILQNSKKALVAKNSALTLAANFPYSFEVNKTIEQNFFYQAFNYINIINISPFATELPDMLKNIDWLANYATETGTNFNIELLLKKSPDQSLTYHNTNLNFFKYSLAQLEKKFKNNKCFNTFIVNDLTALAELYQTNQPNQTNETSIAQKISFEETILRPATPNQEMALLSVYQKDQNLYLQFSVSDNNYVSTAKGFRENKITDDHILVTCQSHPAIGFPKQKRLSFKASAGNDQEEIPPYLSAVTPQNINFQTWKIAANITENYYKLFLTIPLNELFFNLKKENYLHFQFSVINRNLSGEEKEYHSEPLLILFSPDNND